MNITIHNMRNEKPSKPYDFRVDRGTPLENPYVMLREAQRNYVCDQYEQFFNDVMLNRKAVQEYLEQILLAYSEYGMVRLFCWCIPLRCHAESIAAWLKTQIVEEVPGGVK